MNIFRTAWSPVPFNRAGRGRAPQVSGAVRLPHKVHGFPGRIPSSIALFLASLFRTMKSNESAPRHGPSPQETIWVWPGKTLDGTSNSRSQRRNPFVNAGGIMSWTHGPISGGTVNHTDSGDIHITGNIDGGAVVTLISTGGAIIIDGKVDGGSTANLTAAGVIQIGAAGNDPGEQKIDGGSSVTAQATGSLSVGGKIDGGSTATLTSTGGAITIGGKIDGGSVVDLTADGDILIGADASLSGGDRKIDGNSHVVAQAGITIHLFNKIDGGSVSGKHTRVDFKACGGISIDDKIDGGSIVRLATNTGTINIGANIGGGGTNVTFWPANSLQVANGSDPNAIVTLANWVGAFQWCSTAGQEGYYWQNWPFVFGYVTPNRRYPRSLADIVVAVQEAAQQEIPTKAVGGGWSFSDASLPMQTQAQVDAVSIAKRGANGTQDFNNVLQGLNDGTILPADFQPESVESDLAASQTYDQTTLEQTTNSGPNLPFASDTFLIDTRGLASSLQAQLHSIMSDAARKSTVTFFHVEAGITMTDLDQLLDHQNPRLALQASGGSVGATLAGVLASATHGAEFQWPLLVDQVRAIHLVGPDGSEWWIEGEVSIADLKRLQTVYPNIQSSRFIAGRGKFAGLSAQNVLNAVIVSMGTMGIVYSVVIEVVPQFGLQQICVAIPPKPDLNSWETLLQRAGTSVLNLRSGNPAENIKVLKFLLDGSVNGTGIPYNDEKKTNVFCDLAINPLNLDCWITNRQVTSGIPVDGNSPATNWLPALRQTLGSHAVDTVQNSKLLGRVFDFLNWATDVPSVNVSDDINDIEQAIQLGTFITSFPDIFVAGAATLSAQAVANTANEASQPDRGQQFLADALSGFLHAVQGTTNAATGNTSDVSYKIWGFGWPANGFPGRGLEIALPQETAFTFLQSVLFDDALATMKSENKPLIGYISVRVCPPTKTLMGMQQFSPFSIMIEIVAYRSPEANAVMALIQAKALAAKNVMLHWGLENDQMTGANLTVMPVSQALAGTTETRLSAFQKVRQLLANGATSYLVNNFVNRLGL
jgi:hypothetical protein